MTTPSPTLIARTADQIVEACAVEADRLQAIAAQVAKATSSERQKYEYLEASLHMGRLAANLREFRHHFTVTETYLPVVKNADEIIEACANVAWENSAGTTGIEAIRALKGKFMILRMPEPAAWVIDDVAIAIASEADLVWSDVTEERKSLYRQQARAAIAVMRDGAFQETLKLATEGT